MNTNLPTKQGIWEDSNIIIDIAPTSIDLIYGTAIAYDRSKRITITTKSEQLKAKYGLYYSTSITEDFISNTSMKVTMTGTNNTLTVLCNGSIYRLTYDIISSNIQACSNINGVVFSGILPVSQPRLAYNNYDYTIDNNKYVTG